MNVGDIVSYNNRILGQITDLPSNGLAIVDRGNDVSVRSKTGLNVSFSSGDRVWVKDTNKAFTIDEFVYNEDAGCWKASMVPNTGQGFRSDSTQMWFNINNLELSALAESAV